MRSPVVSIGWELWRRNRWASALVLGVIPSCYLLHAMAPGRSVRETLAVFELLGMLFAIATIFWLHAYVDTDSQGRHAGFPSRMFVLPLRTPTLVTLPVLFGIGAIVLFYLAWSHLVFPKWGVRLSWDWLRCHLLSLAAMMVALQAIIWSFHRFPWIRFVLVTAVLVGLGGFGIVMPAENFPGLGERATLLILSSILVVAYVGAILGVQRDRHGAWEGWTGRLLQRLLDAFPRRQTDFRSPAQAQLWFEWRRKGFFLAKLLALPAAASLMFFAVPAVLHFDRTQTWITYTTLPIMVIITASTVGLGLAKSDYWRRNLSLPPFVAIRPVRTGDLVVAKMKVAALIVLCAVPVFCILAIPAFNFFGWIAGEESGFPLWTRFKADNARLIHFSSHPLIVLTVLVLVWKIMIDGLCVGLTGRLATILWRSWLGGAVFFGVIFAIIWLVKNPDPYVKIRPALPWVAVVVLLLKAAATWQAFRAAAARHLYSSPQLWSLRLLWIAMVGCIISAALMLDSGGVISRAWMWLGVAWLFPGPSLATCAVNLDSDRHR